MKKFILLICSLALIVSCAVTVYAWPIYLGPEALAQMGFNMKFNGESIAVLVCDPFDAYINGNECREVSYSGLSNLRDQLVMQSFDVRLMKGFNSDYYYLAFYDRASGSFKGCIGDGGLGSQCVYRALDPAASAAHTIKEIAGTGIYWIDSTDLSSLNTHYVDSTRFDNISRTLHMNVRSQYISIVKESVLLDGTPCYILKYLYNGKWVGVICDQYGPIYCTTIGGGTVPGDTSTGGSGSGATFDDTEVINAIDSVFRAISSVDDSISYVSTYLSRLNNNFLNFYNDFKVKFEMQGNDLSNIYSVLLAMYQSFYDRFSDLDLTYYNDAEIVINNGDSLDWSESDRGAINVEATDIGTLELIGFPNISGYVVDHSFGDDIIVRRNDGTYFPDTWELDGGTVTMPVITDGYASISVTAPVGAVVTLAGNTHTMASAPYSVNVEFGTYAIELSYIDGDETKTSSYTVDVDGHNDYLIDFSYTPGGFVVSVSCTDNSPFSSGYYIEICGERYFVDAYYGSSGEFQVVAGDQIAFGSSSGGSVLVYENDVKLSGSTYVVNSDCSITYSIGGRFYITTLEGSSSSIVGDFDTPTVTVTANPATITPLTIQMLVLPAGSSFWYAVDTEGNQYSFDAVSNLALNRSFVVHTYAAEEIADLDNFPSGYWMVSWSGSSKYITVKFEEYSKFFLWLNRFLINFRDTLYTKMEDITVTANGDVLVNSIDYTGQLNALVASVDTVALNTADLNTSLNVNLDSLVDKLDVLVDQSTESVENLTVDIAVDSDAYNVFYVTDEDGNEESIVDFSGDMLKAGGKLLNFLFRVCFDGAISNLDGSIDDMDSFYFDGAELGGSLWE